MAFIMDYLEEKGDVPFSQLPFNEVDNYAVTKIGTPNYSAVLKEEESVSLEEALERYFTAPGGEGGYLGALASPTITEALRRMKSLPRYRELVLSGYVRRVLPAQTE